MISGVFKYSVLQYVPSQILNERVNIGIVLFFPEKNKLNFIYPKSLKRLKYLFHKVQERKILLYLQQSSQKIEAFNKNKNLFLPDIREDIDLNHFLDTEILKADDSALQFSTIFQSLIYTNNYDKIIQDLYREYFSEYAIKPTKEHITEVHIKRTFERKLKRESVDLISKFKKDFKVNTENNEFTFDYAWQNGSLNLVKPVSFDLKETKKIQEKSVLLYGNLNLLSDISKENNYKFDLVVAKPQNKNSYRSFDKALNTIDKAAVTTDIIFHDEIDSYIHKAFSYLT
jgi:hypothetical protein